MVTCYKCGSQGIQGGCPVCGMDIVKELKTEKQKEIFVNKTKYSMIPEEFVGTQWSKEILINAYPQKEQDRLFHAFANKLERLHDMFVEGTIPGKSVIIISPSKFSKNILAYSCMQNALRHNFSVAPILDTLELKRLLVLSSENPTYKLYNRIDYDRYMNSDVMFITVTKTEYYREALSVIEEILSRRSRMGLTTFVISKFSLRDISINCSDNNYYNLIDNYGNDLKYPVIMEYKE